MLHWIIEFILAWWPWLLGALVLVLYLSPPGLLACFEFYAWCRRNGHPRLLLVATAIGAPTDLFHDRTWFRWVFGKRDYTGLPLKKHTVTWRLTLLCRAALHTPNMPWQMLWALAIGCGYMNIRDPGHIHLEG